MSLVAGFVSPFQQTQMVVDSGIARSVAVANIGTSPDTRLGKWLVIGLTERIQARGRRLSMDALKDTRHIDCQRLI